VETLSARFVNYAIALFFFVVSRPLARKGVTFATKSSYLFSPTVVLIGGTILIFRTPPSDLQGTAMGALIVLTLIAFVVAKATSQMLIKRCGI
jgi:hypothetical protein